MELWMIDMGDAYYLKRRNWEGKQADRVREAEIYMGMPMKEVNKKTSSSLYVSLKIKPWRASLFIGGK
jgi:hypothetical protein